MSKKANPTVIGGFVLGAMALVVAGVLAFGSGTLFRQAETFVSFFKGSVQGLTVGAPVSFRGVNIGKVSKILVNINPENEEIQIPVLMTFEADRISYTGTTKFRDLTIKRLIERGLRAQLVAQSLVTGQLMIELDFHPKSEIRYVGALPEYPELPTVPSDLEKLLKRVEEIPLEKIADSLSEILTAVKNITTSGHLDKIIENLAKVTRHLDQLVLNLDRQVQPVSRSITDTMESATDLVAGTNERIESISQQLAAAIDQADRLLRQIQAEATGIGDAIQKTAKTTQVTLNAAETATHRIGRMVASDSPLMYNLTSTLQQIATAAKALRNLAEYLERHPEALLQGKGGY